MSMSNIEYSVLKRRGGLHNWGFMSSKDEVGFESGEVETMDMDMTFQPELLHQNDFGEYYALQDFEE